MTDPLDALIEHAGAIADKIFAEHGRLVPVWIVEAANGEIAVFGTPWSDAAEKHGVFAAVRDAFARLNAVRYVLVLEALTSPDLTTVPSKHAKRVEIVLLSGEDKRGQQRMVQRKILRSADCTAVLGAPRNFGGRGFAFGGALAHMLPIDNTTQH
jgi:hypothetical protein